MCVDIKEEEFKIKFISRTFNVKIFLLDLLPYIDDIAGQN